jgi:DNA-binding beta-propeller fold protein YncE
VPGRFDEPTSVDISPGGVVYVADAWNRRVQSFSADLTPLAQWPVDSWDSESVVNKPYLRVSPAGEVFVSDPERYRILVFDSEGAFRTTFGQYGADTASFALPLGMAFTPDGHLVVVDSDNHRLLEFVPPPRVANEH